MISLTMDQIILQFQTVLSLYFITLQVVNTESKVYIYKLDQMKEKTIEQTYQKKTPLEHILLRPDTYVGSTQLDKSSKWILRPGAIKFTYEEISYVPALYKIFDEVLVNAADNYQRDRKMNLLKVFIDEKEGSVSVHNNGKGIPVEMHKEEKVYVPELIFGHLLTGSNYNDDEKKVVGGRNGYGAKLANIFSHKFTVECGDSKLRKKFKMTWRKNMTMHGQPEIQSYSGKDYTIVTFHPEFKRFNMECFDQDIIALMCKRVYDMAGLMGNIGVFLNDKEIPIKSFLNYVDMYFQKNEQNAIKIRDANIDTDRWQIVVSLSEGQFRQVSFVNSICTSKGGTHVNYITDQIVNKIQEKLEKKDKSLKVKPFQIKGHLWIFINCLVQNPAFDSQTKENLTLKASAFGSTCQLSEKLIKEVLKTGVIDDIYNEAKNKELSKLAKMTGGTKKAKLIGIPKLEDANDAGTRNSQQCTLILTQGDSAKSLAMAGLQVIGRDNYGVFPLKGKLLNVRQASTKILMGNAQIQNVMKIMGLTVGKEYEDLKSLRYGSIMIMSDQDTDGSHIKGLVINFIHHFWPSLFKKPGFLKQFITPLLKASKGREVHSFYTMSDYKGWAEQIENQKSWKVKYYKGLGTSTDKEAQEYFQRLEQNRIFFKYQGTPDDEAIELVFAKKNIQKRKDWLSSYDPDRVMQYNQREVFYKDFIDLEFIHFSNEDNCRSIASVIDGFKPGQRKIIFACFKRNLKEEIKVAQLSGYVAQHSAYHHGEMSLTMTIINMAQSFVGANNINLLMPNGQFGSRNQGGKDHASARYIFTMLNRVTRLIYPQPDDHTLTYIQDDGQNVQPEFYVPIIPMGLVNGCEGIGSGWSTSIPNFSPRDVAELIVRRLRDNQEFTELNPYYKGYSGTITPKQDGNYEVKGIVEFDEFKAGIIHVKELPVNKWTKDYKEYLESIMTEGDTKIAGIKEYHTKNRVHFEIQLNEQYYEEHQGDIPFFQRFLKLTSNISMKNMVGFNREKRLKRYTTTVQIMEEFFHIRLAYYDKRKEYMVSRLLREVEILSNKARFILEVVQETLVLRNVKRIKIVEMLKTRGYTKFSNFPKVQSTKASAAEKPLKPEDEQNDRDREGQEEQVVDESKEYNYLLSMPLWNITYQKVEDIKKTKTEKTNELMLLEKTDIKEMWLADLVQFLEVLDKVELEQEEERKKGEDKKKIDKGIKARKKNDKKGGKDAKEKVKQDKKNINWDTDTEEQYQAEKPKAKKATKAVQKKSQSKPKEIQQKLTLGSKTGGSNIKKKQAPQKKNEPSQPEDIVARMRKKIQQQKKNGNMKETIIARPIQNKLLSYEDVYKKNDDEDEKVEIVTVYRRASSTKKSKKMQLDSEEEQQNGSSDYQGQDD